MRAAFAYTAIILSVSCSNAQAQNSVAAWRSVSPEMRSCVQVAAKRTGTTLESIVAAGVLPNDPRITDVMKSCGQFVDGLRSNYSCDVKVATGETISTICDQHFAVKEGAGFRKVTKDEAFSHAFTPNAARYWLIEEETQTGRSQREEAIRRQLNAGSAEVENRQSTAAPVKEAANETDLLGSFMRKIDGSWCNPEADRVAKMIRRDAKRLMFVCGASIQCQFTLEGETVKKLHVETIVQKSMLANNRVRLDYIQYGDEFVRALFKARQGEPASIISIDITQTDSGALTVVDTTKSRSDTTGEWETKVGRPGNYIRCQ